jgi:hypothetical protein
MSLSMVRLVLAQAAVALAVVCGSGGRPALAAPIIDAFVIGDIFGTPVYRVTGSGFGPNSSVTIQSDENGIEGFFTSRIDVQADRSGRIINDDLMKKTAACFITIVAIQGDTVFSNIVHLDKPDCTPPSVTGQLNQPPGERPGIFIQGDRFTPFMDVFIVIYVENGPVLTEGAATPDQDGRFNANVLSFGPEACGRRIVVRVTDESTSVVAPELFLQAGPC